MVKTFRGLRLLLSLYLVSAHRVLLPPSAPIQVLNYMKMVKMKPHPFVRINDSSITQSSIDSGSLPWVSSSSTTSCSFSPFSRLSFSSRTTFMSSLVVFAVPVYFFTSLSFSPFIFSLLPWFPCESLFLSFFKAHRRSNQLIILLLLYVLKPAPLLCFDFFPAVVVSLLSWHLFVFIDFSHESFIHSRRSKKKHWRIVTLSITLYCLLRFLSFSSQESMRK